jgi:hypothetical protein
MPVPLMHQFLCAESDSVTTRSSRRQIRTVSGRKPLRGASEWGRPEGKNGRALPDFFCLLACTNAESLEPSRASSMFFCEGLFPKVKAYFAGGF